MTSALTLPALEALAHPSARDALPWRSSACALLALAGVSGATPAAAAIRQAGASRLQSPRRRPSRLPTEIRDLAPEDGACSSTRRSRSPAAPIPPRRRSPSARHRPRARARALECLTSAIYYEAGAGKRPTASAPSRRSCSTASATRPSPTASAAWSMKARPAPPAASSPSPATARWPIAPMPALWNRARKVAEAALNGRGLCRRSAMRPIITPIMSFPTGPRAWSRPTSRARTSSIAGPAAGAVRRRSPTAGRAARAIRRRFASPRSARRASRRRSQTAERHG